MGRGLGAAKLEVGGGLIKHIEYKTKDYKTKDYKTEDYKTKDL